MTFWRPFGILSTTFRRRAGDGLTSFGDLSASSQRRSGDVSATFCRPPGDLPAGFRRRSGELLATFGVLNDVPVAFRRRPGNLPATFRRASDDVLATFWPPSASSQRRFGDVSTTNLKKPKRNKKTLRIYSESTLNPSESNFWSDLKQNPDPGRRQRAIFGSSLAQQFRNTDL